MKRVYYIGLYLYRRTNQKKYKQHNFRDKSIGRTQKYHMLVNWLTWSREYALWELYTAPFIGPYFEAYLHQRTLWPSGLRRETRIRRSTADITISHIFGCAGSNPAGVDFFFLLFHEFIIILLAIYFFLFSFRPSLLKNYNVSNCETNTGSYLVS